MLSINGIAARWRTWSSRSNGPAGLPALHDLGNVVIGTIGLCNASCVHCPTGKVATAHVPRAPMPMKLFRKIIDSIVEERVEVRSGIFFGLFGDGLLDPHVVERARYVRQLLPGTMLSVNTNGAGFNSARHGALVEDVSLLSLHCESIRPGTYDQLMKPLRLVNVLPKIEAILETFPGKVRVSVPVSRRNVEELQDIRDWFLTRGALEVIFDPLSSRCAEDRTLFDSLALAPVPISCSADIMTDLIVDCDGTVLACCQDFQRREQLANFSDQSLREVLYNASRLHFRTMLVQKRHGDLDTCSRCSADCRTPAFPYDRLPTDLMHLAERAAESN